MALREQTPRLPLLSFAQARFAIACAAASSAIHERRPALARSVRAWVVLLVAALLAGCAGDPPAATRPAGPHAATLADLWWLLFGMASAVFIGVMTYLVYALFRSRKASVKNAGAPPSHPRSVVWGGIVMPAIVLTIVFTATVRTLWALSTPEQESPLTIHVAGKQWWWQVRYTDYQFETANEIHVPVGQPVQIKLTSDNVIHSFWVPQLHGKLDLVPGYANTIWIEADTPGEYRGLCAEFCGIQHANMMFLVIAQPQEEFEAWVAAQQRPAALPQDELTQQGLDLFLGANCIECHTVRGTHATGNLGPDLTHLASRRTLASALMENNIGNLGGWIANPQHSKPGNLMPPADELNGEQLQALLAYLQTLE